MQKDDTYTESEKGQSMVEFAFTLVILIILLAGTVDLGRAFFTYMSLREAAQEGALYGSINPTETAQIESRVRNSSSMLQSLSADPSAITTVQTTIVGSPCTGNVISVQVVYSNFPITMPFLGAIIGSQTVAIRSTAVDTVLSPACH